MDFIINFDQQLFLWIQQNCHIPFLDVLLPWLRKKENWYPLYFLIIAFLIIKYRWIGFRIILIGFLGLLLSDVISSQILKPIFKRPRPCNDAIISQQFTPTIKCSNGYSFTSSHAANHFAVMFSLCLFFYLRKKWILIPGIIWAGSISMAQVYVGVHYPIDIFGGAILGTGIACLLHWTIKKYFIKYFKLP